MAKRKNLTDRQKRIRRRRRKSTMSRVVFALEIIILVVLMGGLFVYAKLGNMNYEDLNFENVDADETEASEQYIVSTKNGELFKDIQTKYGDCISDEAEKAESLEEHNTTVL